MNKSVAFALPLLALIFSVESAAAQSVSRGPSQGRSEEEVSSATPAAVRSAVANAETRAVYEAAGWRALWTGAARQALSDALGARAEHGLDRVTFLNADTAGSTADRDVAQTEAALAYAAALSRGRTDPGEFHQIYTLPRPDIDIATGLVEALKAGNVAEWIAGLAPQDAAYRTLSKSYAALAAGKASPSSAGISEAGPIHVGESDGRVPAIVRQLAGDGYLDGPVSDDTRYTPQVASAVERLQRDYGIVADGIVGPDTIGVLNLGPDDHRRALAVSLERRRWLERTPPPTRIDVNTAAAQLEYYRDGELVDTRKVIVGKSGRETPALQSPIYRLVANPTWTVPKSIQNGELAHVGSRYLRLHDMVIRNGWIVQQPGPQNALGQVKFDMANEHAIYLHDTGSPGLFGRSQRHLSHGCVRVADALGFAEMLATHEGVAEAWQEARGSTEPTFVPLPNRIPVRLLYYNAFVNADGEVAFRTDPYGWNDPIAKQLGFADGSQRKARADDVDVGP